jgi:hypothetical protein
MPCHWCQERAAATILTVSGSINLCRFCSESWWSIQLQPPSDDFWSIERETFSDGSEVPPNRPRCEAA